MWRVDVACITPAERGAVSDATRFVFDLCSSVEASPCPLGIRLWPRVRRAWRSRTYRTPVAGPRVEAAGGAGARRRRSSRVFTNY